jgi:hypothetical protein
MSGPAETDAGDTVVKDMAITQREFLRDLPTALAGADFRVEGTRVEIGDAVKGITIRLRDLPPRRLSGLLSLARTEVTLVFHGHAPSERKTFLERFDLAYRRGGG